MQEYTSSVNEVCASILFEFLLELLQSNDLETANIVLRQVYSQYEIDNDWSIKADVQIHGISIEWPLEGGGFLDYCAMHKISTELQNIDPSDFYYMVIKTAFSYPEVCKRLVKPISNGPESQQYLLNIAILVGNEAFVFAFFKVFEGIHKAIRHNFFNGDTSGYEPIKTCSEKLYEVYKQALDEHEKELIDIKYIEHSSESSTLSCLANRHFVGEYKKRLKGSENFVRRFDTLHTLTNKSYDDLNCQSVSFSAVDSTLKSVENIIPNNEIKIDVCNEHYYTAESLDECKYIPLISNEIISETPENAIFCSEKLSTEISERIKNILASNNVLTGFSDDWFRQSNYMNIVPKECARKNPIHSFIRMGRLKETVALIIVKPVMQFLEYYDLNKPIYLEEETPIDYFKKNFGVHNSFMGYGEDLGVYNLIYLLRLFPKYIKNMSYNPLRFYVDENYMQLLKLLIWIEPNARKLLIHKNIPQNYNAPIDIIGRWTVIDALKYDSMVLHRNRKPVDLYERCKSDAIYKIREDCITYLGFLNLIADFAEKVDNSIEILPSKYKNFLNFYIEVE